MAIVELSGGSAKMEVRTWAGLLGVAEGRNLWEEIRNHLGGIFTEDTGLRLGNNRGCSSLNSSGVARSEAKDLCFM
jgi:hypothetical protein